MKSEKIIIYTDGGSRGNPGPAGIGVVIANSKGDTIKEYSKDIGTRTNNEAEYEAVILGLQKAKQMLGKEKIKKMEIEMRMDSELVASQLNGDYKIENEGLIPLFIKIHNIRVELGKIKFIQIPRQKNKDADRLANEAMNRKETKKLF